MEYKYIDAEKLIHDLEERIYFYSKGFSAGDLIRKDAIEALLRNIKHQYSHQYTLQREHSNPPGYDKALLEVKKMVDKLSDESCIGHSDYDSGLYNGITETCMKLRGFIKARLDSDEQPEVNWKPSKEQMYILNWVANILLNHDGIMEAEAAKKLNSLYTDLQKLL